MLGAPLILIALPQAESVSAAPTASWRMARNVVRNGLFQRNALLSLTH